MNRRDFLKSSSQATLATIVVRYVLVEQAHATTLPGQVSWSERGWTGQHLYEGVVKTPTQSFVQRTLARIASTNSTGEYYHWDPLAAVVASNPDLCVKRSKVRLSVAAARGADLGLKNGEPREAFPLTAFDGRERHGLSERNARALVSSKKNPPIDVCMQVNAGAFEDEFIRVVSGQ